MAKSPDNYPDRFLDTVFTVPLGGDPYSNETARQMTARQILRDATQPVECAAHNFYVMACANEFAALWRKWSEQNSSN